MHCVTGTELDGRQTKRVFSQAPKTSLASELEKKGKVRQKGWEAQAEH